MSRLALAYLIGFVVTTVLSGGAFALWWFLLRHKHSLGLSAALKKRAGIDGDVDLIVHTRYKNQWRPHQKINVSYTGSVDKFEWSYTLNNGNSYINAGANLNDKTTVILEIPAAAFTTGYRVRVRKIGSGDTLAQTRAFTVTPTFTATGIGFTRKADVEVGQTVLVAYRIDNTLVEGATHVQWEISRDRKSWLLVKPQTFNPHTRTLRWSTVGQSGNVKLYCRLRTTDLTEKGFPSELVVEGVYPVTLKTAADHASSAGSSADFTAFQWSVGPSDSHGPATLGDLLKFTWTVTGSAVTAINVSYSASATGPFVTLGDDATNIAVSNVAITASVTQDMMNAGVVHFRITDTNNVAAFLVSPVPLALDCTWHFVKQVSPLDFKVKSTNNADRIVLPLSVPCRVNTDFRSTAQWTAFFTNPDFQSHKATLTVQAVSNGQTSTDMNMTLGIDAGTLFANPQAQLKQSSKISLKFVGQSTALITPYDIQLDGTVLVDQNTVISSVIVQSTDGRGRTHQLPEVHVQVNGVNLKHQTLTFCLIRGTGVGSDMSNCHQLQSVAGSQAETFITVLQLPSCTMGTNFRIGVRPESANPTIDTLVVDTELSFIVPGKVWSRGETAVTYAYTWSNLGSISFAAGGGGRMQLPLPATLDCYMSQIDQHNGWSLFYDDVTVGSTDTQVTQSPQYDAITQSLSWSPDASLLDHSLSFRLVVSHNDLTLTFTSSALSVGLAGGTQGANVITVTHFKPLISGFTANISGFVTGQEMKLYSPSFSALSKVSDASWYYRTTSTATQLSVLRHVAKLTAEANTFIAPVPPGVTSSTIQLVVVDTAHNTVAASTVDIIWSYQFVTMIKEDGEARRCPEDGSIKFAWGVYMGGGNVTFDDHDKLRVIVNNSGATTVVNNSSLPFTMATDIVRFYYTSTTTGVAPTDTELDITLDTSGLSIPPVVGVGTDRITISPDNDGLMCGVPPGVGTGGGPPGAS